MTTRRTPAHCVWGRKDPGARTTADHEASGQRVELAAIASARPVADSGRRSPANLGRYCSSSAHASSAGRHRGVRSAGHDAWAPELPDHLREKIALGETRRALGELTIAADSLRDEACECSDAACLVGHAAEARVKNDASERLLACSERMPAIGLPEERCVR